MRQLRTSGSMSGDGKRGVAERPKLLRPSSTLPFLRGGKCQVRPAAVTQSFPDCTGALARHYRRQMKHKRYAGCMA